MASGRNSRSALRLAFSLMVLLAGVLISSTPVRAPTYVGGGPYTELTWDPAGSPYIVGTDIYVGRLNILPGTIVQLNSSVRLTVGTLNATGTSAAYVHIGGSGLSRIIVQQGGIAEFVNFTGMRWGLQIDGANAGMRIESSVFDGGYGGIRATAASDITVANSSFLGPSESILLDRSSNVTIGNNSFEWSAYAVQLINSSWNLLADNRIANMQACLLFADSPYNQVRGNAMTDVSGGCMAYNGSTSESLNNTIDATNLIAGKPIRYFYGLRDAILEGYETAHLVVAAGRNVTVRGNAMLGTGALIAIMSRDVSLEGNAWATGDFGGSAVLLDRVSNVTVAGNILAPRFYRAVLVRGGDNVTVWGNVVDGHQNGIFADTVTTLSIFNNSFKEPYSDIAIDVRRSRDVSIGRNGAEGEGGGLFLSEASGGVVENNSFTRSTNLGGQCVRLENVTGFVFRDNLVGGCAANAIKAGSSSANEFHRNSFLSAPVLALDDGAANVWDSGYPLGGNFWDDYAGEDFFGGPDQDVPGSDGIGDVPYAIDGDSLDRYPLLQATGPRDPPRITSVRADPWTQLVGGDVRLSAVVSDDFAVASVWVDVQGPGGYRLNDSMAYSGASTWAANLTTLTVPGAYGFTVWAVDVTDARASAFGNFAVLADTEGPAISHVPVTSALAGQPIAIAASVGDSSGVNAVELHYLPPLETSYVVTSMANVGGDTYEATIPPQPIAGALSYFIEATDAFGNVRTHPSSGASAPHMISILADTNGDGMPDEEDPDDDGDGMPDSWEVGRGLNPLVNDAANDEDHDGLSNLEEFGTGTDPSNRDTDGDGALDGADPDPLDPRIPSASIPMWAFLLALGLSASMVGLTLWFFKLRRRGD